MQFPPLPAAGLALGLLIAPVAAQSLASPFAPEMLDLSEASLQELELPGAPIEGFRVEIELDGAPLQVSFNRHSMRSDGFELLVKGEDGRFTPHEPAPVVTYRGGVVGNPGALVAGSLREDGLHALIRLDSERLYGVQPAIGTSGRHAVYPMSAILPRDVSCGANDRDHGRASAPTSSGGAEGSNQVVQIGVDSDNQFYLDQGSSVLATQQEIESILNATEAIYESDAGITFEVTVVIVRTFEPDPYAGDIFDRLDDLLIEWTTDLADVPRDIGHMFTGLGVDSGVIGIAYLEAVCSWDFGFGISDVEWTDNFTNKVALVAHEIGHNFGAFHCDGTSDCQIMCSGLGGCDPDLSSFGSQAKSEINAFKGVIDCLSPEGACGPVAYGLTAGNTTSLAAFGDASPGSNLTLVYANPITAPSTAFVGISANQASTPFGPATALIDLTSILVITTGVSFNDTYQAETEVIAIPAIPALAGSTYYMQAAHSAGGPIIELSNGVALTLCP